IADGDEAVTAKGTTNDTHNATSTRGWSMRTRGASPRFRVRAAVGLSCMPSRLPEFGSGLVVRTRRGVSAPGGLARFRARAQLTQQTRIYGPVRGIGRIPPLPPHK